MPNFAFKFISGKYQGGEFPLPDEGELVIGRAADLDMVLVEDMVSRKHAKLSCSRGALMLVDLGSTNGTFVNGEKINRVQLKKDDRVLIGTSILRLTQLDDAADGPLSTDRDSIKEMMTNLGQRAPAPSTSMSGDLEEVPLPDLLQLFATNKKTGTLTLTAETRGRIFMREGAVLHATLQSEPAMLPMKIMCRLLNWNTGQFQFESSPNLGDVPSSFSSSTESVLMEALRQNDEAQRLLGAFPSLDATLRLNVPLSGRLADLSEVELDTLQLAINQLRLGSIMDRAAQSDHEVLANLQKLLKDGFLALA